MKLPNAEFWKRKLAAYLHDTPSKCLEIWKHEQRSKEAMQAAGLTELGYERQADWIAATADRFPFPKYQHLESKFDGDRSPFIHPLSGDPICFDSPFRSSWEAIEGEKSIQPRLQEGSLEKLPEDEQWRARFFAHWRLWKQHASERDWRYAFLPADTRIPDHTIWNHMSIVSALSTCSADNEQLQPAFLKLQLGPVQDFIAAARSTRDLWSGSYLLSWLMAAGLKRLSELVGPDAVLFPSLVGQPLFDLHWKEELWGKVAIGKDASGNDTFCWDRSCNPGTKELLTPNLPNVFLALVPAQQAEELAQAVDQAIREEWRRICKHCWDYMKESGAWEDTFAGLNLEAIQQRFNAQTERHLSISWQVTPWPKDIKDFDQVERMLENIPTPNEDDKTLLERFQTIRDMAEKHMPKEHRDHRYYIGQDRGPKEKLNNIGLAWSVLYALNDWQLSAIRNTRTFDAWNNQHLQASRGWTPREANNKDALTGKEEAIAGGADFADKLNCIKLRHRFKKSDRVGAITLVKRVWDLAYLHTEFRLELGKSPMQMPNTLRMARMQPNYRDDDEVADEGTDFEDGNDKYFAVLAFDGDSIGKWVSGSKCPPIGGQFSYYLDDDRHAAKAKGSRSYFKNLQSSHPDLKQVIDDFLQTRRPLNPSYHLQFSENLSNFALHCARPIVESYAGKLIFAGGDDVLALLPASTAVDCAIALQQAFRGTKIDTDTLPSFDTSDGTGHSQSAASEPSLPHHLKVEQNGLVIKQAGLLTEQTTRLLVPGPCATASVGIAIAHYKAPLQAVVKAAKKAEGRAKSKYQRNALALTILKGSGETLHWGSRFNPLSDETDSEHSLKKELFSEEITAGLLLLRRIANAMSNKQVSGKFPHRLEELLQPYCSVGTGLRAAIQDSPDFQVDDVILRELEHTFSRQRNPGLTPNEASSLLECLRKHLKSYLDDLGQSYQNNPSRSPSATSLIQFKLSEVIGLCRSASFLRRIQQQD